MTRGRHLLVVGALLAPLLAPSLLVTGLTPAGRALLLGLLWVACTVILSELLWRRSVVPLRELLDELDETDPANARWRLHDLKETLELCRRERDRTAALLEDLSSSLGEGLLVIGGDLRVRLINPVALRFCGVEEVTTRRLLHEILRDPEVLSRVKAAAAGDECDPVVVENPRGLWELRAFPIREGGAVILVSEVGLVRRAAEFRRRFVQDLSHELRSPLAVLRTTVEAMEDEVSPQLAEITVRQVERLDRLTRELYELATIETGQLELSLEAVPVLDVVQEVVRDLGPEAERCGVAVRVEVAEDASALCDRRGLYRVLSNLLDNSIKYNHTGGWVELRSRNAGDQLRLKVADNGDGIPAGELQAVFQRFYRIDRARTPGRGGLGLGLAIVKHMVQHMGGSLELDSREGVGTTVTLSFPSRA